ncbi:hypothetical protein IW138_003378 [Coemansia sp. RSA 986]|nr:hypothetical protein IW138_003378 [Coemansia sp. RSA 986]
MVSFVCNYCQDTLKKAKLDVHAQRCRNASFSCIDCGVDFEGASYRQHTSCITEPEKYEGKSKPKKQQQKNKESKQNSAVPSRTSVSTVDQLTKKAQAIETDTQSENNASKSKKRKAVETTSNKSSKKASSAGWDSTNLPNDAVDALVSAITHVVQTQKSEKASFKTLKKQCLKLAVNHPKSKLSESEAKKSFKKAIFEALSTGKVALAKNQ